MRSVGCTIHTHVAVVAFSRAVSLPIASELSGRLELFQFEATVVRLCKISSILRCVPRENSFCTCSSGILVVLTVDVAWFAMRSCKAMADSIMIVSAT